MSIYGDPFLFISNTIVLLPETIAKLVIDDGYRPFLPRYIHQYAYIWGMTFLYGWFPAIILGSFWQGWISDNDWRSKADNRKVDNKIDAYFCMCQIISGSQSQKTISKRVRKKGLFAMGSETVAATYYWTDLTIKDLKTKENENMRIPLANLPWNQGDILTYAINKDSGLLQLYNKTANTQLPTGGPWDNRVPPFHFMITALAYASTAGLTILLYEVLSGTQSEYHLIGLITIALGIGSPALYMLLNIFTRKTRHGIRESKLVMANIFGIYSI